MTQEGEEEGHQLLMKLTRIKTIAGIDEVGKGALFGPVYACAVVLSKKNGLKLTEEGLKDSKLLTSSKRAHLVPLIKELSCSWSIGQASSGEIDALGIRYATEKAMIRAIFGLSIKPELILVDGSLPIRIWEGKQKTLIKGESKSSEIAAASVLAKEARDKLIKEFALEYPLYGLETNVGYGTAFHCKAIKKLGPTEMHRTTFLSKLMSSN